MTGSPIINLQLLLVRSLFDRALIAAQENSDIGNMNAMLLADVASETIIKQVLTDRQVTFGKEDKLNELLTKLETAVPSTKGQPENSMARRLRDARNPVQHSGSVPSATSVAGHLHDAGHFITAVMKKAFNVEFDRVSATALVRSPDIRAALDAAGNALSAGNHVEGARFVVGAFEVLRVRWGRWVRRALGSTGRLESILPRRLSTAAISVFGAEHPDNREPATADGSWRDLGLMSLGFSVHELLRLQHLRAGVEARIRSADGDDAAPATITPAEVAFCIEAVARQVWRLEATQPELFLLSDEVPEPEWKLDDDPI